MIYTFLFLCYMAPSYTLWLFPPQPEPPIVYPEPVITCPGTCERMPSIQEQGDSSYSLWLEL